MKQIQMVAVALCLALAEYAAAGQPLDNATNSPIITEAAKLEGKIRAKMQAGAVKEAGLSNELHEIDAIMARHKDADPEQLAQVLGLKAAVYLEMLKDYDKGAVVLRLIEKDYPTSQMGKRATAILAALENHKEANNDADKLKGSLVVGSAFPDFKETATDGEPISVSQYKGKIVLVDFWATWCGPCMGEVPDVVKTYARFHDKGFEIVGISLDQDKDKLLSVTKEKHMTWRQYFDGLQWQNKLAVKYGVSAIPSSYLLDREGKIVAKDLRGEALEAAVGKALGAD